MFTRINSIIAVALFSCLSFGCRQHGTSGVPNVDAHRLEVEEWYKNRVNSLKRENGWLNLVGLEWLKEGVNSFGADSIYEIRLPAGQVPGKLGDFLVEGGKVYFVPMLPGVLADSVQISGKDLIFDTEAKVSKNLQFKSLRWSVIKRSDAYGVRIRDLEAPALNSFHGIERYPVDLDWRVSARFVPYEPAREIMITNVIGQTTPNPSPGYLEFEKNGEKYKIEALDAEDELYLIIADLTSGGDTYGGGRYLYVKKPVQGDEVIIDFNKAYNPPCVFTPYATCPLPPRQNILEIAITAGEKTFGEH